MEYSVAKIFEEKYKPFDDGPSGAQIILSHRKVIPFRKRGENISSPRASLAEKVNDHKKSLVSKGIIFEKPTSSVKGWVCTNAFDVVEASYDVRKDVWQTVEGKYISDVICWSSLEFSEEDLLSLTFDDFIYRNASSSEVFGNRSGRPFISKFGKTNPVPLSVIRETYDLGPYDKEVFLEVGEDGNIRLSSKRWKGHEDSFRG